MNKINLYNKIVEAILKGIKNALIEGECCGGDFGGVCSPYSTPMNTIGIGDPVPAGAPAMTAGEFASDTNLGSGDRFDVIDLSGKSKKGKRRKKSKNKKDVIATKKGLPFYPYLLFTK